MFGYHENHDAWALKKKNTSLEGQGNLNRPTEGHIQLSPGHGGAQPPQGQQQTGQAGQLLCHLKQPWNLMKDIKRSTCCSKI